MRGLHPSFVARALPLQFHFSEFGREVVVNEYGFEFEFGAKERTHEN